MSKLSHIKDRIVDSATNFSGVLLTFASQGEVLARLKKLTQAPSEVYDKALDMEYLKTRLNGGDHRLFDGGHDVLNAWDRVRGAMPDDSFQQEVLGYVTSLWKDVTTPKGLPFTTVSKENFDSWVDSATTWIPGVDRQYLYDLMSFDAMEILGTALGAIGVVFALKKEDQEKLAELLGSMGILSIASANPIMAIFVIGITGYAYMKKKLELDKVAMTKGIAITSMSVAIFSVLGLNLFVELILVGVLTKIFRKQVLDNVTFHARLKEIVISQGNKYKENIDGCIKSIFKMRTVR